MNRFFLPVQVAAASLLALACVGAQAAPVSGQGTWESTLQARDLDGNADNGPEAWFDTALNVTWVANANLAGVSGFVSRFHGPGGNMVFGEGLQWTGSLAVGGVSGWRLPAFSMDTGESELGHLFSVTLGNVDALDNTGPFANVQPHVYWVEDPSAFKAALFHMGNGSLDSENAFRDRPALVWALLDGDVGAAATPVSMGSPTLPVPEPEAWALLVSGVVVAGLMAGRRRKQVA